MPLDISDEVLLGVVPWRDDLVDEQGWNTLGKIYSSTLIRARAHMGFIRDSILVFNLQAEGNINRQELLDLRTEQEEVVAKFPPFIAFRPEDVSDRSISGPTLYAKLLIELEFLQNIFLIERLLCRVDNTTLSQELLRVSVKMVSTTLIFWTNKDKVIGLYDFEWIVMGYGAPAAGILCLDLLHPRTKNSGLVSCISRSEVIQMLCIFNGFLDWIKPLTPNRELSCCVRRVIQRVLDETLNFSANSLEPVVDTMDWGAEMEINMSGFGYDLLGTFDWMLPEVVPSDR
ncbi:hypothetical protein V2A60_004267 [Cordyceps javanica]